MKQINITKFGAENYASFQERIEIDVKKGLNFVVGPNGTGKTSCLEIPLVCFFGENSKGDRINNLINNKVGKNCYLYTDFEMIGDDGTRTNYKCERYGNYKGSNSVILSKNSQEFRKGHKEVTNEIIKIVGPKRLVTNTIIFPQKASGLFLDLTDSERKDIFKKILNLDNYPLYQKQASEEEKELNNKLREIDKNQEVYKQRLSELEETLSELNKKKEEFENKKKDQLESLESEISSIREEITNLKSEIDEYDYEELKNNVQKISQEISDIKSELNSIKSNEEKEVENLYHSSKSKKSDIMEKYNDQKSKLEEDKYRRLGEIDQSSQESINEQFESKNKIDKEYDKVENELVSEQSRVDIDIDRKINDYTEMLNSGKTYCYECYQEVSLDHIRDKINELNEEKDKVNNRMKELKNKLDDLQNQKMKIASEVENKNEEIKKQKQEVENEIKDKISDLSNKANNAKQKIEEQTENYKKEIQDKYKNKKSKLEKDLDNKNNELSELNENVEFIDNVSNDIENYKNRLEYKLRQLEDKKNETFDESQITNTKYRITNTKEQIDELNQNKREVEKELEVVKFWKQGFSNSGIPSMLIDESIPFLNKRIKEYLDTISGGRYIVSFDTMKETQGGEFRDKISVNVYDNETGANSKSQLSGGQERIVDIATILTLSDLSSQMQGVTCNLKIWDEIFDSLDNEAIMHVSRVLRQLAKEKSIFVVSHQHMDEIEVDQTLRFIS